MSELSVDFELSRQGSDTSMGADVDSKRLNSQSAPSNMYSPEEFELMKRLAKGDESAMERLIELHGSMLARLVGRLTAWSTDHEDLFQEVLLQIWQKSNSFRGAGPLPAWLRRIAVNRCHNYNRRKNSLAKLLTNFLEFRRIRVGDQRDEQPSSKIERALSQLSPNDRAVLVLYYLEELSSEEIASALDIRKETLHVRLHRARNKLRIMLGGEDRP